MNLWDLQSFYKQHNVQAVFLASMLSFHRKYCRQSIILLQINNDKVKLCQYCYRTVTYLEQMGIIIEGRTISICNILIVLTNLKDGSGIWILLFLLLSYICPPWWILIIPSLQKIHIFLCICKINITHTLKDIFYSKLEFCKCSLYSTTHPSAWSASRHFIATWNFHYQLHQ